MYVKVPTNFIAALCGVLSGSLLGVSICLTAIMPYSGWGIGVLGGGAGVLFTLLFSLLD